MALYKTSKDKNHTHLVYMSDDLGSGMSSIKKSHKHVIERLEDGEIVMSPGEDGHTHTLVEYTPQTPRKKKKSESDKVAEVHAMFKAAASADCKSREAAEESEKFYMGDQWDSKTKNDLKAQKRASITVNEIEAKLDILLGFQMQNRTDLQFAPVEEGDGGVVPVINAFYKNVETQCDYPNEESKIFRDQAMVGRGSIHVYMDFDKDVQGKIVIEHMPWRDVYYGPHAREDAADCEHITSSKMFSRGKVRQMWPEKEKDIELMFEKFELSDKTIIDNPGDQYATGEDVRTNFDGKPLVDIERQEVRVFENYHKEYYTLYSLLIQQDGEVFDIHDLTKREADEWETIDIIQVVRRNRYRIKRYTVAGSVLLDENELREFPIIPVYAKKVNSKWYGKVEPAKDPQREVNKRHSQSIDILNKAASYSWTIDENTFGDTREETNFMNNSSTPGYVVKVADMNQSKPELNQGTKVPSEVLGMMELASTKIQSLMNIPVDVTSDGNIRDVSGVAIREKRRSIQMANEYLFTNLDSAKRRVAKVVMGLAQDNYDAARILRVVMNSRPKDDLDAQANQIDAAEAEAMLRNTDLLKFDVTPVPSAASPTARAANFQIAMEMMAQGMQLPPEILIKLSDFPFKQEILGSLAQQAEASSKAANEAAEAEKFKSLPDEIKAQLISTGQVTVGTPPQTEQPQPPLVAEQPAGGPNV